MINHIRYYIGSGLDPYENLAIEKHLLESVEPGQCILYLWQNENTVVIGRNQNPWTECRLTLLEQEGGKLARRLSGGGAVFHDKGNLNFTFLVCTDDYDLDKQLSVIQTACAYAGIDTQRSGRNDILAQGQKFSGNAFYHSQGRSYHHGTLLIDADMEKLSRYLSPSKAKLQAKGVSSVRSRVVNLRTLCPTLTCPDMQELMLRAFQEVYALTASPICVHSREQIRTDVEENRSWDWLYGKKLPLSFECQQHFPWGNVQLQLDVQSGVVRQVRVYSDAMDWTLAPKLEQALTDCLFRTDALQQAVRSGIDQPDIADDLCQMLSEQNL